MIDLGNAATASPSGLFSKPRGLTKSNTMAAAANRSLGPGSTSVGRRSTIGYESKSSSSEKTNAIGGDATPTYVSLLIDAACNRAVSNPQQGAFCVETRRPWMNAV